MVGTVSLFVFQPTFSPSPPHPLLSLPHFLYFLPCHFRACPSKEWGGRRRKERKALTYFSCQAILMVKRVLPLCLPLHGMGFNIEHCPVRIYEKLENFNDVFLFQ